MTRASWSSTSAPAACGPRSSRPDATVDAVHYQEVLPSSPAPGFVEFDAAAMADAALDVARRGARRGRPGRRGRHRQPAGVDDRVGPRHRRARRPRPRLAGPAHRRRLPGAAGRGPAPRAQRVGHQARLPARHGRPRPQRATSCFGTVDTWMAWHLSGGARPRHRPVQRRRHRPAHAPTAPAGTTDVLDALRIPPAVLPAIVDSTGVVGEATRARRRAADRRHRRRPAGVARRPGLRARRAWPRSPSAPAACSTSASAPTGPPSPRRGRAAGRSRSWPGGAPARRPGASRRSCCRPAPTSSGCATTSASSPPPAESDDVAARVRRHRRRGVRARPARPGHAPLGLRRPRHAARPHPGHRPGRGGAGRARGRRPAGRRPGRGGRGRHRRCRIDRAAGRRRHEPPTPRSCRRWPTPPSARSRCRPCARPPRSAPRFLAGLAVGTWAGWDDIAATWAPARVVEPAGVARPRPLARGRRPGRRLVPRAERDQLLTDAVAEPSALVNA